MGRYKMWRARNTEYMPVWKTIIYLIPVCVFSIVLLLAFLAFMNTITPKPANGQTLAIGEIVNRDQHIVLAGANRDSGMLFWEHGLERFDIAAMGIHSLDGPQWWGAGAGVGVQLVRSPIASIATYPSLLVFNDGWDATTLSGLTIASRVLAETPLVIGYAGVNPGFNIKAHSWSLDAAPIGMMLGSWRGAYLFLEYDTRTKLPAIGVMHAINSGVPR